MKNLTFLILFTIGLLSHGQTEVGPRIEAYPAGTITTIQVSLFAGEKTAWNLKAGYNSTDRRHWGVHDHEEGGGYGFGGDYRRYLKEGNRGLYGELGVELWFLTIDWINHLSCPQCLSIGGFSSKITVLQPTLGIGYQVRTKNDAWAASVGAHFGREINIKTEGEEVGQGGISIVAISVTRRL